LDDLEVGRDARDGIEREGDRLPKEFSSHLGNYAGCHSVRQVQECFAAAFMLAGRPCDYDVTARPAADVSREATQLDSSSARMGRA
jgi:hypothetical protein